MAGRTAPEMLALRVRLPRGYADFWALIRARHAKVGRFTVTEIADETCVQRQSVEHYLARLVAAGIAVKTCRRGTGVTAAQVYTLTRAPKVAPRLRDDGSEIGATAQERLWRGVRVLKQFDTRELAYWSDRIPLKTAQRYVNQLARAGYLTVQGVSRRPATYRLKPGMNTGPLPPSILVTEAIWDPNLKRIVGEGAASFAGSAP
jgi:hypothetical protein